MYTLRRVIMIKNYYAKLFQRNARGGMTVIKKKTRKGVSLVLAGLLMLSLTACGSQAGGSGGAAGTPGSSATPVVQESGTPAVENFNLEGYPIVNTPVTITVAGPLNALTPTWKGLNLFEHFTEKTGIAFAFDEYSADAWGEKKPLLFASDDLPDLFISAGFTAKELADYGGQGQLVALNSLIESYGAEIKNAFSEIPDAKALSTSSDGNIYGLPLINQIPRDMHRRYWINTVWLDNVGLDVPQTLDDFYEVLKAFKEQDANGNGDKDDEIPLSGQNGYGVDGLILNALGLNSSASDYQIIAGNDGTVVCMNTTEEYKEYLKYMNRLYKEKLLDNDFLIQTQEQLNAKGEANTLGVFNSSASYVTCGTEIGFNYTQFDALTSSLNSTKMVTSTPGVHIGVSAITSVNKYPEATFRLLDYCFSEDGSIVNRNGEENVGWRWVDKAAGTWENKQPGSEDATLKLREEVTAINSFPSWYRVDYQLGQGSKNALWLNEMTAQFSYPYFIAQYPVLSFTDEQLAKIAPVENDVSTYIKEARARFIIGEDDIDKTWDAYVQTIEKMGIGTVVEINQQAYNNYLEAKK